MQQTVDIVTQNALTVAVVILGAVFAFWILRKIVKVVFSLVIVAVLAVAVLFYCIRAGYISRENAEKMNPLNCERIRQTVREAGAWAGAQAKDAAKRALDATVRETVDCLAATNRPGK